MTNLAYSWAAQQLTEYLTALGTCEDVPCALQLGVATGALFVHEVRYFRDLMNLQSSTAWRDHPILPMDVLTQNDGAAARLQSGITEEGPAGVLIGAGSLGSALLNLWGRSAWGRWTVIDKDHIKPHNLSRHAAYAQHIGETKATVVAGLHAAVMEGATEIVPLVADATDFTQEPTDHFYGTDMGLRDPFGNPIRILQQGPAAVRKEARQAEKVAG